MYLYQHALFCSLCFEPLRRCINSYLVPYENVFHYHRQHQFYLSFEHLTHCQIVSDIYNYYCSTNILIFQMLLLNLNTEGLKIYFNSLNASLSLLIVPVPCRQKFKAILK